MLPILTLMYGRRKRAYEIAEELKKTDFDIIVFQEAFFPAARKIIAKGISTLYPYNYGPPNNSWHIKSSSGVWILSKIELKLVKVIRFKHSADSDNLARKGAMLLEGSHNNHPFQLIATHLQANDDQQALRTEQLEMIYQELVAPFERPQVPQLICGDMNTRIEQRGYYEAMLQILNAYNGEISGPVKHTYDGFNNQLTRSTGFKDGTTTFDYILLRPNGTTIQNISRFVNVLKHNGQDLSDHYGLSCGIEWKV